MATENVLQFPACNEKKNLTSVLEGIISQVKSGDYPDDPALHRLSEGIKKARKMDKYDREVWDARFETYVMEMGRLKSRVECLQMRVNKLLSICHTLRDKR